jgi:hypothetical protein
LKKYVSTEVEAEAGPPTIVPPKAVMGVVRLSCSPRAIAVTLTENVQDAPEARVAPARLMLFEPATAVIVPPPQEPVRPFGVETTSPLGKGSVKLTFNRVIVLEAGLEILKVKVVLLLGPKI